MITTYPGTGHQSHVFWEDSTYALPRCANCGCWQGALISYDPCPAIGTKVKLPALTGPTCWKCDKELSAELDAYHGKTVGMDKQCIRCRPRCEGGFGPNPQRNPGPFGGFP